MKTGYKYIIATVLFSIFACNSAKETTSDIESNEEISTIISISNKQFASSEMAIGQLEEISFDKNIKVTGKIQLPNKSKAVLSSIMSGTVGSMNITEGQWVKKGQTLITITNPELIDLQQDYLVLQSNLEFLLAEQTRKQLLQQENLSSTNEVLQARSEYQSTLAKFKTIGQKLKMYGIPTENVSIENLKSSISIMAPISGFIDQLGAVNGQYVTPETPLATIDNKAYMQLELEILERDALSIKKGQAISFTGQGNKSVVRTGKVVLISQSIQENGLVRVYCSIDNNIDLLPGMYINAEVVLDSYIAKAVPEKAITQLDGKDNLLTLVNKDAENMNFEPRFVEVGNRKGAFVEVVNAELFEGKSILTDGVYYLVN